MKKLVGSYNLGFRPVNLFIDTDRTGGSVELTPEERGKPTAINVGINSPLVIAVSTLLHEAYEACLIDLNARYEPHPAYSSESSDFIFVMSHNQLGEAHDRVGEFLVDTYTAFVLAYNKYSVYGKGTK